MFVPELGSLVYFAGLFALMAVTSLLLRKVGVKRFVVTFAVAHLLYYVVLSLMYFPWEKDAQHQLFWVYPTEVDFPIGLICFYFPLENLGIVGLVLQCVVLGTLQYAAVGWILDLCIAKRMKLGMQKAC